MKINNLLLSQTVKTFAKGLANLQNFPCFKTLDKILKLFLVLIVNMVINTLIN